MVKIVVYNLKTFSNTHLTFVNESEFPQFLKQFILLPYLNTEIVITGIIKKIPNRPFKLFFCPTCHFLYSNITPEFEKNELNNHCCNTIKKTTSQDVQRLIFEYALIYTLTIKVFKDNNIYTFSIIPKFCMKFFLLFGLVQERSRIINFCEKDSDLSRVFNIKLILKPPSTLQEMCVNTIKNLSISTTQLPKVVIERYNL